MDEIKSNQNSIAAATAAIGSIVFITIITILADLMPGLKGWLAATFTHHWIGKGVLTAGLFVMVFWLVKSARTSPTGEEALPSLLRAAAWFAIIGSLAMLAFFLYETFGK